MKDVLPFVLEPLTYVLAICVFAGISSLWVKSKNITDLVYSGFVLYLTSFVIIRWVQLPKMVLLTLLLLLMIVGVGLFVRMILQIKPAIKSLLFYTALFFVAYFLLYLLPQIVGGIDSKHYAMDMAWFMNLDWLKSSSNVLGWGSESLFVDANNFHRAGTSALGWLNNLSNIAITTSTVQRHILLYLILTAIQFFRLIFTSKRTKTLIHVLVTTLFLLILIGSHYLQSLFAFGQLNAAIGVFLLVSIVLEIIQLNQINWHWLDGWRLCLLVFLLFISYTELIAILPIFIAAAFLFSGKVSFKDLFRSLIPILIGTIPVFVIQHHRFIKYLIGQSKAAVGAYPLGTSFRGDIGTIGSNLISSTSSTNYGIFAMFIMIALLLLFTVLLFREPKSNKISAIIKAILLWTCVIYSVILVVISMNTSPNPNYVLFKLSSWMAPFLAVVLLALWSHLEATSKHFIKISSLVVISSLALFSGFNTIKFLARYMHAPAQMLPQFVTEQRDLVLTETDSQGRLLYDMDWVKNLAPWKNIPVRSNANKTSL